MARKVIRYGSKRLMNVIQFFGVVMLGVVLMLTTVCIVMLLSGCSAADEGAGAPQTTGSALVFSVTEGTTRAPQGTTRAPRGTMTLDGNDGTESLKDKGFGVFACHTGAHPYVSTSASANLMWNQLVTYNNTENAWEYAPLVYWPNDDGEAEQYVTFFAYAPHSTQANGCIADMSRPEEKGDPWILYQLGGTSEAEGANGWKAQQVDLLYDFKKDKKREYPIASNKIDFGFKHALASIGDQITVGVGESVAERLKALYDGSPVTLTVSTITIDYLLTRKGRLVLNNNGQPNWQAVESEDSKVHRLLTFTPNLVMAQATSASACTTSSFVSEAGQGVLYIPLESGAGKQKVTISAQYTVATDGNDGVISDGTIETTLDLSYISNASEGHNLNITIQIPDI